MSQERIHPDARIGAVHLTVSDLGRSTAFYREHLGFQIQWERDGTAGLGAGAADLLVLRESAGAPLADRTTGLYHFAILVPSRLELARSLRHLALGRTAMQGFSDHLVSEAIYLADPDGIGIEVYRDRPRAEWPMTGGRIQMASDPLDVESLLREAEEDARRPDAVEWAGLPAGTTIGHVHLHVSFIEDTEAFYTQAIGLDLTQRYGGSAIFLSAGGYHHHVGANTWAGVGAPRPPLGAIGLDHFEFLVPSRNDVERTAERIRAAGAEPALAGDRLKVSDPSGNTLVIAPR